jgi:CRP/FNR family transcriptional regulator, dissimilatory nitrate respiration regulator
VCYNIINVTFVTNGGKNEKNMPFIENLITSSSDMVEKHYKKGDIIFSEGEICYSLALVIKGQVTISTLTYFDSEYTITTINEHDTFGEFLLFSEENIFLGDVIANRDSTVLFLKKEKLIALFFLKKELLEDFLSFTSLKALQMQKKIKLLSQRSIKDKIMFFLFNNEKKSINLKKEDLAKILNIPRPSLSRELIRLHREGYILMDKKEITVKK